MLDCNQPRGRWGRGSALDHMFLDHDNGLPAARGHSRYVIQPVSMQMFYRKCAKTLELRSEMLSPNLFNLQGECSTASPIAKRKRKQTSTRLTLAETPGEYWTNVSQDKISRGCTFCFLVGTYRYLHFADVDIENPMVFLPDGSSRRSKEILQSAFLMNQLREPQSGE